MESNQPLISVVMPVYNAEEYIESAIQSVERQTYKNWELLLIDDKSSDSSGLICDRWAKKESRISVYHLPENQGAGNARNVGIDKAKGKYLAFMDSDDTISSTLYETVISNSENKEIDLFIWGVTEEYFNKENNKVDENKLSMPSCIYTDIGKVRKSVIDLEDKTLFGYQWNHLYRLELLKEKRIYFEPVILYEDFFFNLNVIKYVNAMCVVDDTGYYYAKRMNQSITQRYTPEYFILSRRRVLDMVTLYKAWDMFDEKVQESCGNRYLRYICSALMRNNDPNARLSLEDRIEWIKKLFKDSLYQEVVKTCDVHSKQLKVLQKCINKKSITGCLVIGKIVYIIKYRYPNLFRRSSRIN